jgi:hypothetical protein
MGNGYDYKEAKQMAGANTSVEYSYQNKNIQAEVQCQTVGKGNRK